AFPCAVAGFRCDLPDGGGGRRRRRGAGSSRKALRAVAADRDDSDPRFLGQSQAGDLRPQLQSAAAAGQAIGGASAGCRAALNLYFVVSTPACLITSAHFLVSAAIKYQKCSGMSPATVSPVSACFH